MGGDIPPLQDLASSGSVLDSWLVRGGGNCVLSCAFENHLGEVSIPLEDWFRNDNSLDFEDPDNKVCPTYLGANFLWLNLEMNALAPKSQCGFHPK